MLEILEYVKLVCSWNVIDFVYSVYEFDLIYSICFDL